MQKHLIFTALAAMLLLAACETPAPLPVRTMYVSANAHNLIDSYRDLVTQTGTKACTYPQGDPNAKRRYIGTNSAMPAKGFNPSDKANGIVTFASFYFYSDANPDELIPFHSIWAPSRTAVPCPLQTDKSAAGFNATICLDFAPETVVFPYDTCNGKGNAEFEALLIPLAAYQTAPGRGPIKAGANIVAAFGAIAIKPADIKAIHDVYLESEGAYMHQNEPGQYNNVGSSKGIVCEVLLKSGKTELCYLLNNYDEGGTLRWKAKK